MVKSNGKLFGPNKGKEFQRKWIERFSYVPDSITLLGDFMGEMEG